MPEYNVDRIRQIMGEINAFRNLLVHLYWKVDDKKVYSILKEDIRDIREYLKVINRSIA